MEKKTRKTSLFWNLTTVDRFTVSEGGATLRIKPVMEEDDQKSLWCSLLLYDKKERRWRPRKTIHHFLYVGEGKMKLTPEDIINLGNRWNIR